MIIVQLRHVRGARLCSQGTRDWFERHGLDWNQFLNEGLPIDQVDKIDDVFAARVAAVARKEHENG